MRLVVVSHTDHWSRSDGTLVGWAATVREIDYLARLFDEVVHVAPLHPGDAPASARQYASGRVELRPISPAGGPRLLDKLSVLRRWPQWGRTILNEAAQADALHIRCPAALSLVAVILLFVTRQPKVRWVKFAGSWNGHRHEPLATRLQRHLLRRSGHGAQVTINAAPQSPCAESRAPHVHLFLNPCLAEEELNDAVPERPPGSFGLVFVGRLYALKRVGDILQALAALELAWNEEWGSLPELDVVGDGPDRPALEAQSRELGIADRVRFRGWCARTALPQLYSRSHLVVLASESEGWPKVISEAMSTGAVPVATAVSCIPEILASCGTGTTFSVGDVSELAQAIRAYAADRARWQRESRAAAHAARRFTYEAWLPRVRDLLEAGRASRPRTTAKVAS